MNKVMICDTCDKEKGDVYFYKINEPPWRMSTCMKCHRRRKKMKARNKRNYIMAEKRRKPENQNCIIYRRKNSNMVKQRIYQAKRTPLFLQYNQMIANHVKKEYGLSQRHLNMLLFIQPIVPFTNEQFRNCAKLLDIAHTELLNNFKKMGLIYVWRRRMSKGRLPHIYDFTEKGHNLMRDVYQWSIGKKRVPEYEYNNALNVMANLRSSRKIDTTP